MKHRRGVGGALMGAAGTVLLVAGMLYSGRVGTHTAGGRILQLGQKVVIDAGHGGFDPGAIGSCTGVREDILNLAVAQMLADALEDRGYRVLMTRSDEHAVGSTKNADMARRREMISSSGADAGISIHMNAVSDHSVRGPEVIYYHDSKHGALLAQTLQFQINNALKPAKPRNASAGRYFILKAGSMPIVIVECGFLTHAEEEKMLQDTAYQQRIARAIADGIDAFFEQVHQ